MLNILMYYTPPQFSCRQVARFHLPACINRDRVENSVGPDQLASQKPADLELHGFQNDISR